MAPDLLAKLDEDQTLMLRSIYAGYATNRTWPTWLSVVRRFRQESSVDPASVRDSFPVVGRRKGLEPSYSAIWFDPNHAGEDAEMRLTIAAGIHLDEHRAAEALVRSVQYLAKLVANANPDADRIRITRDSLAREMNLDPNVMLPIPELLHHEPLALVSSYSAPSSGNWEVVLGEVLYEYRLISGLRGYVEKTVELVNKSQADTPVASVMLEQQPVAPVADYVDAGLISGLSAVRDCPLDTRKLVALLSELNVNYAAGQPYACLMLIRAIMDHVPPIFGHDSYSNIVDQLKLARTDKNYLTQLLKSRFLSDDVLHRHIGRRPDITAMHDVPNRMSVNALARLALDRLDELAEAAQKRVKWSLEQVTKHKYRLRNDGTDSAYGVHIVGDIGGSGVITDIDEFPSGHAESYLLAITFGSTTDRLVVTWHDKPDRSDEPRRAELVVA